MSFRTLPIRAGGAGASTVSCPFEISSKSDPNNESRFIYTFRPGTAAGFVPSNIFAEFSASKTGIIYAKIKALSDGKKITSCTLVVDSNHPTNQIPLANSLPASVEILLYLIKDGVQYRAIGCSSISIYGHEQYKLTKTPPAGAGELTYTPYYIWRFD